MDRGPKSISIGGHYSIKKKTQELGGSFLCSNLAIKPLLARGVSNHINSQWVKNL